MSSRRLIVLGCGTSVGVPMIGCDCRVCTSANPKNNRTRSSVLFQLPGGNLLVDTTPELRLQMVRERIPVAHAVLYTHYHVDHVFGLDDARLFPGKIGGPLPLYCTADTEDVIRQAFAYAFVPGSEDLPPGVIPKLEFRRIPPGPFPVLGELVTPIPLIHGRFDCLGFRIGDVAYCTDVSTVPESSYPMLEGLDVLILDALRPDRPHPSHLGVPQALDVIARVKPRRAYFTHMGHEMDYDHPPALPPNVAFAHDGLTFNF